MCWWYHSVLPPIAPVKDQVAVKCHDAKKCDGHNQMVWASCSSATNVQTKISHHVWIWRWKGEGGEFLFVATTMHGKWLRWYFSWKSNQMQHIQTQVKITLVHFSLDWTLNRRWMGGTVYVNCTPWDGTGDLRSTYWVRSSWIAW